MKNREYRPYKFNFKYEYKTYKNIGVEDKIIYKAEKNILYKLRFKIRKIYNWDEKRYRNFAKFSRWEEYVNEEIRNKINNDKKIYKDFVHYLEYERRSYKYSQSLIIGISVPAYMVLATGALTVFGLKSSNNCSVQDMLIINIFNWFMFVPILLAVIVILYTLLTRYTKRYYFYSDYIMVIKKNKKYILPAIKN